MIDPRLLEMLKNANIEGARIPNAGTPRPRVGTVSPLTRAPTPGFSGGTLKGEGTSRILAALLGLDPNAQRPGISGNPAMQQGLMQAGLALMSAPKTPGSLMGNIAGAIGYGQQAAQGAQAQQQRQAMLANLPPGMQRMMALLSPEDQSKFLMEQAKPGEGFTLAPGAARFDASGNPIVANPVADKPEVDPSKVREFQFYQTLDPAQKKEYERLYGPQTGVSVNVGAQEGVIEKSFAETYVNAQDAAREARTSLGELDRLENGPKALLGC